MPQPRVLILRAPGTNCDVETAFAFETAGAIAERVHIGRVLERADVLADYQILCIPGGFSYGDDVAAGRIFGNQIRHHLAERMQAFRDEGKLILGICNGFQVLIKSGLLLDEADGPQATLTWNDSGQFEDRWVRLGVRGELSVFLKGIDQMYLPVAHAEGKLVTRDEVTLARLDAAGQLPLRYLPLDNSANGTGDQVEVPFPDNPNGSQLAAAAMCDESGRVLGLMPHPERHIDPVQHPRWTRGEGGEQGDGLAVFQNAVGYFA
ncbi:MAG: phosphoribosylformylglycinamidine synthase subunit PurQ [Planctomycetota bacterium]|mgnify:CR=1 FL=1|nr:MAG: phosphoribosylformylglycinamidine synthase subunit PurQ [Planctomycetota bacterium]REJ96691.1 MAG: phosphoribosylformylglycinamidine synthase subunit PurQ [Planctomycetota bacterium]REK22292.1 MAG: phosphoribosylformylglycinamidine synthase subunit PurQ [Planctomycetota bacterium]REK41079.1 MAG: phosphoribosylformylglycinamidine synthase subunit PurQ [Planctomycetota bacterium]